MDNFTNNAAREFKIKPKLNNENQWIKTIFLILYFQNIASYIATTLLFEKNKQRLVTYV